jgi:enoyl-CoA hydratase
VADTQIKRDKDVWRIALSRPGKRNALSHSMVLELTEVLQAARHSPCILIVESATPGIFAAGGDLGELRTRRGDSALPASHAAMLNLLASHRWPTIALVDGPAYGGGCELALACDFRIATPRASFAQPELGLGIMAAGGANHRLPRLVGISVARHMLYAGATIDAHDGLQAGLVDQVVDGPEAAATAFVAAIRTRSWSALELTKIALGSLMASTGEFDHVAQAVLMDSEEKDARIAAFLDRRVQRTNPD